MKCCARMVFLLCTYASSVAEAGSPVAKVLEMMEQMVDKAKDEKHKEVVQFSAFDQFCQEQQKKAEDQIEAARETLDVLKADIAGYAAKAARMSKRIAKLDEQLAKMNLQKKEATNVRKSENAEFIKFQKDYGESIDALNRAVIVLKKQDYSQPQALIQLKALKSHGMLKLFDSHAEQLIDSFLSRSESSEGLAEEAPEAHGYEFQSSGVIEMLEKLQDKFEAELGKAQRSEMQTEQNFKLLMRDMQSNIDSLQKQRDQTAGVKSKQLHKQASAKGDSSETEAQKANDKKYVKDLVTVCVMKTKDFKTRQQMRAEEIAAINKAMNIIASSKVQGAATQHLPKLLQVRAPSLLLSGSLKIESRTTTRVQETLTRFLRLQAQRQNSKVLLMAANHASADPFGKVKNMIKNLINKLLEEANEEAEHKGWCDKELSVNKKTRHEKTKAVDELLAEKEELEASISKLTEEIADNLKSVQDLDESMAEATDLRMKEQAKNKETISDAQAAQAAVEQAATVLKEFYEKAGESINLLDTSNVDHPPIFGNDYQGLRSENGGIMGMLEVIQSDFARLESETAASEASATKEYNSFLQGSKEDKGSKVAAVEHKESKKQDNAEALVSTKEDLEGTQKELDSALAYFDKLKPSCVDAGVSYEDRVARRKSEIESLQQALKIMQGEDIS